MLHTQVTLLATSRYIQSKYWYQHYNDLQPLGEHHTYSHRLLFTQKRTTLFVLIVLRKAPTNT
jgi:hypothetical protein